MAFAGGEIRERHFVGAADFGVQLVDLAGESVRRKPFGHRVRHPGMPGRLFPASRGARGEVELCLPS